MKQPMNIRLSDTSRAALERLAAQQGFEKAGRGNVSGFLNWFGAVADAAENETALLIDAAADRAAGGDEWNTLAMLKPLLPPMTVTATSPTEAFMFYIYGLHLEGDDEIRYIGSTCNPKERMIQHKAGDSRNPAKDEWTTSNRDRLRMKILQSGVKESDRRAAEQRAILECQGKGHRLFNDRRASRTCATTEDVTWWLDHVEGDNPIR